MYLQIVFYIISFCNQIDARNSLTHGLYLHCLVDQLGHYLMFCQLVFDKEAISNGFRSENARV